MSDYDQHGNHFPDHNHLQNWPSDAYGEDPSPPRSRAFPRLGVKLGTFSVAVLIALAILAFSYVTERNAQIPQGTPPCTYDAHGQLKTEPCKVTPESAAKQRDIQAETEARLDRIRGQIQQKQKGENAK